MDNIIFATKDLFRNYVNFKGRLPRAGYWWAYLGYLILYILTAIIANLANMPWLNSVFALALFLPMLSAAVRRFHDVGKSGYWILTLYLLTFGLLLVSVVSIIFGSSALVLGSGNGFGVGLIISLISGIAIIGLGIFELVILVMDSKEDNKYGPKLTFEEYKRKIEEENVKQNNL